jgi:head-tail adaptor
VTAPLPDIAALNRRLVLEAPVETPDGAGGVMRGYEPAATLWAQVLPASARAEIVADSLDAALRHRIIMRAGPDITTRHRLRDGARIYHIVAAHESADRRFLEVDAEERVT